jgi:ABC-2 type transport system permease protein
MSTDIVRRRTDTSRGRDDPWNTEHTPSRWAVVRVVFEKYITLLKRYWFNTVAGLLTNYIMFVFAFFGGQAAAPTLVENNLAGIIIGFFVWSMSWGAFQQSAQDLTREAQWGTLEQQYMTPVGITWILAARIAANLLVTLVTGGAVLVAMMATTGRWLTLDPVTIAPLAFLTMGSAAGLGFAFGGLALIYKRISSVFLIVQFLLLGAISAPDIAVANLLPLSLGTDLLHHAMTENVLLWELPVTDLAMLVAVTAGYLVFGLGALRYAITVARRRGIMGHY